MKLHIHAAGVDEIVEVKDAAEALRRTKSEAAKRAPFMLRPVVNAMSDLTFAAEAVKRHNAEKKRNDAIPKSAEEFLQWGIERGFVSVVE
ncbi:MAG TPA: hypothetical protein VF681_03275 [Abditibacteriaceae bacterium]|jgi:hypothetical protein